MRRRIFFWIAYIEITVAILFCVSMTRRIYVAPSMNTSQAQISLEAQAEPVIQPTQESMPLTVSEVVAPAPLAVRRSHLIIPSIQVNAPIVAVGLKPDGSMDVAHSYSEVGWYKGGSTPGAPGAAVIEGHLDTQTSPYAVFYNLNKLMPGDEVHVVDASGATFRFIVTGSKRYTLSDPTSEIFAPTKESHLNLVTCDGAWIEEKKTYDERLVVFTARVQ